jgi:hypothetical protein
LQKSFFKIQSGEINKDDYIGVVFLGAYFKNHITLSLKPMESQLNKSNTLLNWVLILLLSVFIAGCNNNPAPSEKPAKGNSSSKSRKIKAKPTVNPWTINSFAARPDDSTARKYVRYVTDGNFSKNSGPNGYLYAEMLVTKVSAGIFLHESQKSNPMEEFNGPVHITMKNTEGSELQLTSGRGWNKSGGILIEKNNNDYSQFRIFMLQSTGMINVDITDADSTLYHFNINADGFSAAFSRI